jgi:hypothetical protein
MRSFKAKLLSFVSIICILSCLFTINASALAEGTVFDAILSGDEYAIIGEKYVLNVNYEAYREETSRSGGVAEFKISININDFVIFTEDGDYFTTNEDLGITYKTHKDLFYYEYEDDYIYDEAEAVGIDPSYFMSR